MTDGTSRWVNQLMENIYPEVFDVTGGTSAPNAGSILINNSDGTLSWTSQTNPFDFQQAVLDRDLTTSPAASDGDRYIIAGIGGLWSGFTIDDIVEWDGTEWDNYTPTEGTMTYVIDEDLFIMYDSADWQNFGVAIGLDSINDIGDVTITSLSDNEVLLSNSGNWINQTFAQADIPTKTYVDGLDHDHATPISTHAGDTDPHGDRAFASALDHDHATPISTHAGAGDPHGDRAYSDGLGHHTIYSHPTSAGNVHIPTGGSTDQHLVYTSSGTAVWTDPSGDYLGLEGLSTYTHIVMAGSMAGGDHTQGDLIVDSEGFRNYVSSSDDERVYMVVMPPAWLVRYCEAQSLTLRVTTVTMHSRSTRNECYISQTTIRVAKHKAASPTTIYDSATDIHNGSTGYLSTVCNVTDTIVPKGDGIAFVIWFWQDSALRVIVKGFDITYTMT